ncbi:MAG: hypothetical protein GKR77_06615 [Legionellales bacterium]|nr:hypothetical protein [Legionellales bacterium]
MLDYLSLNLEVKKQITSLFDLALQLHWQPEQLIAADLLKQQTIQTLRSLYIPQVTTTDLAAVQYALAALVDELVAYSTWSAKEDWLGQPLQVILFDDHLAGERFFERLTILRQTPSTPLLVLDIYYLCLQLGFQGKHRLHDPNILITLKRTLGQQLAKRPSTPRKRNSTIALRISQSSRWPSCVIQPMKRYGWMLGVMGFFYLGCHAAIWQLKQQLLSLKPFL